MINYFLSKRTISLIKKFPENGSDKPHHAIIIAHKEKPKNGEFDPIDYSSGEDFLISEFQSSLKHVNYKVYEVNTREQVIPIILNEHVTHLWLFGHGQRNKLRFNSGNLCYFEVKNAPKKVFIGQYHCNSVFGKSLADYNNPLVQDVTRWLRMDPLIRFSVSRKLRELEAKDLL